MKYFDIILFAHAMLAGLVAASPQPHHHVFVPHRVKRIPDGTTIVQAAAVTVEVYQLNGQLIDLNQLCDGIADGNYTLPGNEIPAGCQSLTASSQPTPTPSTSTAVLVVTSVTSAASSSANTSVAASTVESAAASSASASSAQYSSAPVQSATVNTNASANYASTTGTEETFPDGQLDCSTFPSQYGAVPLDWLGTEGWASIQTPQDVGDAYDNIVTAVSGGCTEGAFCAYACAPGYQMMQWPQKQGATGQSVGGIYCQNGKLHLTNTNMSQSLCGAGVGNVYVNNTMSQQTAVCRTVYPGKPAVPTSISSLIPY